MKETVPNTKLFNKFIKAVFFIKKEEHCSIRQIRAMVNVNNVNKVNKAKDYIAESSFSRALKGDKNIIGEAKLYHIVVTLNTHILNTYNHTWNETKEIYEVLEQYLSPKLDNSKLDGLNGVYRAYTWDEFTKEKTGIGHIHSFKIEIKSSKEVYCQTGGTSFEKGHLKLLGSERVIMEFHNNDRHRTIIAIFFIGTLNLIELKRRKIFQLGYVDSGHIYVSSGSLFLERTNETYKKIKTKSWPLPYFQKTKSRAFMNFLKGAQQIMYNV